MGSGRSMVEGCHGAMKPLGPMAEGWAPAMGRAVRGSGGSGHELEPLKLTLGP